MTARGRPGHAAASPASPSPRRVRAAPQAAVMVPVGRALRRPGVQFPYRRTLTLDELRVGEASVPAGRGVAVDLVLEATGDAVVAAGTLAAEVDCECRRCLEPFVLLVATSVQEIFEPRPTEGETYPLLGEEIDLEPLVRDALLLALPLAPLCRDDCPGPDPEGRPLAGGEPAPSVASVTSRGAAKPDRAAHPDDRATGTPGEADGVEAADGAEAAERPPDPRWAALRQLRFDA